MTHDEIILGIDLGTTFSSAAAWVSNNVQLVRDADGDAPQGLRQGDDFPVPEW